MNAKTMKVVLESTEQSTRAICNLKELLAESAARIDNLKRLIGCGNMDAEQTEKAIKDMIAERSELLSVRRQNIALTSVLNAVGDLPRESSETTTAYAARLAKVFGERSGAAAEYQALAEKRLNDLAELHIKLAKLETRESELNALHDAIESLPGFPMQPPETYTEYLQRLAAANTINDERATAMDGHLQAIEKAILKADAFRKLPKESYAEYITRLAADRARLAADLEHLTASTAETTQRLRAQLDGNNQQYAESMAVIDDLRKQRDEWTEHKYLVHFAPGAHGLSWAVVDKGVITEISPFLSGSDVRGLSAPKPQIGLWFTRVVHKPCPHSLQSVQVEMPVVIRAIENAEAAKAAVNMDAEISKLATERDNFRARWEESLAERDRAVDEARRTSESNQAMQVQLADTDKQRRADKFESESTLRVALLIIKCLHSCEGLGAIIDATDWNDECQRVIDMARIAEDRDDLILEVDFADQWGSRVSDPIKRGARLATEHTELTNRLSSVARLEGELSLHLQIIARMLMQPTIAMKTNELEWNGSAQQVLKVAWGMFGDVHDVLNTPKEPSA